jgi:hypothetical protein
MINPCGYQKAFDAYEKDLEQLASIGRRLIDGAKADNAECNKIQNEIKRKGKASKKHENAVGDLEAKKKTFLAQWDKWNVSGKDATNRFHAAIDAEDEKLVVRIRGLCAYITGTGDSDAGISYLYGEVKEYDSLKGNFPARKAKFTQICSVLSAVVDAADKQRGSMLPGSSILDE